MAVSSRVVILVLCGVLTSYCCVSLMDPLIGVPPHDLERYSATVRLSVFYVSSYLRLIQGVHVFRWKCHDFKGPCQ